MRNYGAFAVQIVIEYTELDALAERAVYTGPIDAYFGYRFGPLEYRSVRFETETLDTPNFQGNAAVNYTDRETPWTRIIEHKWFQFGKESTRPWRKRSRASSSAAGWGNTSITTWIRSSRRR